MMKQLIFIGFSAALLLTTASIAAAQQDSAAAFEARAVPVHYADLDLNQTTDASALLSRLRVAATRACERREVAQSSPLMRRANEACRARALDEAVERLDEPELTRLHERQRR